MCSVLKCQWFGQSDAFYRWHSAIISIHTWASLRNLKKQQLFTWHWNKHGHGLKANSVLYWRWSLAKHTVLWYFCTWSIWSFTINVCESLNSYVFRLIFNPSVGGFFLLSNVNTALLLRGNAVPEPQGRKGIFLSWLFVNKVKWADVQGLRWPFQVEVSQPNPPVLLVSGKPIERIPLRTGALGLWERFVIITLLI